MRTRGLTLVATGLLVATAAGPGEARVVRFEVEQTRLFADGIEWGHAGAYERLDGRAYFEVDPFDPRNAVIVNLDKAPRNGDGMVEFSSPFFILKPVDMARGNQKLFYGINNRGNKIEITGRGFPPSAEPSNPNDPLTAADVGNNNPLLESGYAIVDAGWQGDGPLEPDNNQLFPDFPVATNPDGSPIVAAKRLEYQPFESSFTEQFGTRLGQGPRQFWKPYEAADTDTSNSTLAVRDHPNDPPRADPVRPVGLRQLPDGGGEPRADHDRHLPVRGFRAAADLRADLPGQRPDRDGPRVCRHPRHRLVPAPSDA